MPSTATVAIRWDTDGKIPTMFATVRVLEERRIFGRHEYLITPLSGSGQAWVQSQNLTLEENDNA